jgi:hypothetical protein
LDALLVTGNRALLSALPGEPWTNLNLAVAELTVAHSVHPVHPLSEVATLVEPELRVARTDMASDEYAGAEGTAEQ